MRQENALHILYHKNTVGIRLAPYALISRIPQIPDQLDLAQTSTLPISARSLETWLALDSLNNGDCKRVYIPALIPEKPTEEYITPKVNRSAPRTRRGPNFRS